MDEMLALGEAGGRANRAHAAHNMELDALRCLALLSLVSANIPFNLFFWHSALGDFEQRYWNGNVGIDLFLAISGFLVARSLFPELGHAVDASERVAVVGEFLLRRCWRLLPPMGAWLTITLLIGLMLNRSGAFHSWDGNLALAETAILAIANVRFGELLAGDAGLLFSYWTLSLELQFYLVLPALFLLLRKRLALAAALLIACQFVLPVYYLIFRVGALSAGVLVAVWSLRGDHARRRPDFLGAWSPLLPLCILALGGAVLSDVGHPLVVFPFGISALLCGLLVYMASFDRGYILRTGAVSRFCVWLGRRAYAIGLTHLPAFALTREILHRVMPPLFTITTRTATIYLMCGMGLTMLLAESTYRFLERPCADYGRRVRLGSAMSEAV